MRSSCEVLISIDTAKALAGMHEQCLVCPYHHKVPCVGGIQFFKSANNVILSPGNEEGFIRPEYFKTAIRLKGGMSKSLGQFQIIMELTHLMYTRRISRLLAARLAQQLELDKKCWDTTGLVVK